MLGGVDTPIDRSEVGWGVIALDLVDVVGDFGGLQGSPELRFEGTAMGSIGGSIAHRGHSSFAPSRLSKSSGIQSGHSDNSGVHDYRVSTKDDRISDIAISFK